jgi:hypothetical protein
LAAATCVVCLTVCVTVLVAGALVSAAGNVLVSTVDGAVCSGAGAGAGVGVAGGAVSVVTGCACCAAIGVDESARAAAIAGRALARKYLFAFLMMEENRYAPARASWLSAARAVTSVERWTAS